MRIHTPLRVILVALLLVATAGSEHASSAANAVPTLVGPPSLDKAVAAGKLPPVAKRLPETPAVADFSDTGKTIGHYGGDLRMLMASTKDIRMMTVYGYARLIAYTPDLELKPDIAKSIDVEDNRIFTIHLRKGQRWSDGYPFTAEDFRYYWQDVATNKDLAPFGPPPVMLVNGQRPKFEVLDKWTVRYTWPEPNPYFLPALAGARPLSIYRPAHYLKHYHAKYTDVAKLNAMAEEVGARNWAGLHNRLDEPYRFDNPDLPTLQPWMNTTRPPSERYVFVRNPYYYRVDPAGHQLPYIDRVIVNITDNKLIPAKTGAGDSDLQARYLRFDNYTFLKAGEKRNHYQVRLWRTAKGSQVALYPNLNVQDPVWQKLVRDVRFRRALSLAIDRHAVNQVVYYGLATEGNNTILPRSPLFKPEYRRDWAQYDPERANKLLDEVGLSRRNEEGVRLLADGRQLQIIVETAGESTEETDVLELIRDNWANVGIKLYIKPSQREVFRSRIFAGKAVMSIWSGLENGIPTPDTPPDELAPTSQQQLQWPMWGQYFETRGTAGKPIPSSMKYVGELAQLEMQWRHSHSREDRARIWHRMLEIQAQQVFTIGIVSGVRQPVVVNNRLRNVPQEGIYNWDPGAYFGIYRPDTFWFAKNPRQLGS